MTKFTIASYNIYKDDGNFPYRIFDLANKIDSKKLDIICFQEDFTSKKFTSSLYLNKKLKFNYLSTKTREKTRNGILSSSNLTIVSKYKMKLLEELYFDKGKSEERACQFVEVKVEKNRLLILNTHLSHISKEDRISQIKKIVKVLKKYENYDFIMFCGDLNALPNSEEIELIKEFGFKDENIQESHEDGVTIDYIFYKTAIENLQVKSKIILKKYSDHYCLLNSFKF